MLVNNFFIRCCLKNLTHQANPRSPSAFSASNQIPIGHVLTELLKIFYLKLGDFFKCRSLLLSLCHVIPRRDRFAPIAALQGDTGWLPCVYRQWISIIRYWNRLILLDENRLTKTVFNSDYETCQNKNNWCSDIKNMLGTIGLSDHFYNRETVDLSYATRKTKEHFTSQRRNSIAQTPKLKTYKLFKNAHTTDQYILLNLQKNERSMLAQLRCGILPLRIETGRYTGEPADSRLCIFCDSSEIENESILRPRVVFITL